jgi:putative ABC transport system permease protein
MNRIALFAIRMATPRADREWVVGDTLEEYGRIARAEGETAARRWLRREVWRVLAWAPRHYSVGAGRPSSAAAETTGDGAMTAGWQDIRYAVRLLGRSPGFTLTAVLTLALGIGANAAMFAVVNGVLLKPLPFPDGDRLMLVHLLSPDRERPGVFSELVWSYPKYRTLAGVQQVFEELALFSAREFELGGDGEPERVRGEVVSDRYPAVLGLAPIAGRVFAFEEADVAGAPAVAMISEALWRRRFAGDPAALGRTIRINRALHTIVGILPSGFRGLSGDADVWVPLAGVEPVQLDQAQSHSYYLVARRRPEFSAAAAVAAVRTLGRQVDRAHARPDAGASPWGATAVSLNDSRADVDVRRASFVLLGAVGVVLLIACVNITNLVAARSLARRREVALRVAIGASRGRILRQFLAEGLLLSTLGAAAGVAVAVLLLRVASALLPDADIFFRTAVATGTPRTAGAAGLTRIGASMIGLDAATLLFAAGVAALTAILVSLVPAVQASSQRPLDALKASLSSGRMGRRGSGARGTLVTAQIALALILLAGAGLMIRSAQHLRGTEIGVTDANVLTARVNLPRAIYDAESGGALFAELAARIRAQPGVESMGFGSCPPVSGGCSTTIMWFPPASFAPGGNDPMVGIHWVTPDYFSTLGIRLLAGRGFTDFDRRGQPNVLLVNETAARTIWPNATPIGKRAAVGMGGFGDAGGTVVGVVSDVRYRSIEAGARPEVYLPSAQSYQSTMRLFIRSERPDMVLGAISRALRDLDPSLPLSEVKTMRERAADAMWRTRVGVWLLSAFAALALLLTAIGIFGVVAQAVAQRTSEIGIRIALGAQSRDVYALLMRGLATMTILGIAIGVGAALGLTRLMAALLYGVEPDDPTTMLTVVLLLAAIALAAGYVPARRATQVDAIAALKAE